MIAEPSKDKPKPEPKKKSPEAERAVVKPKPKPEPPEESWTGGVDHFDERINQHFNKRI